MPLEALVRLQVRRSLNRLQRGTPGLHSLPRRFYEPFLLCGPLGVSGCFCVRPGRFKPNERTARGTLKPSCSCRGLAIVRHGCTRQRAQDRTGTRMAQLLLELEPQGTTCTLTTQNMISKSVWCCPIPGCWSSACTRNHEARKLHECHWQRISADNSLFQLATKMSPHARAKYLAGSRGPTKAPR